MFNVALLPTNPNVCMSKDTKQTISHTQSPQCQIEFSDFLGRFNLYFLAQLFYIRCSFEKARAVRKGGIREGMSFRVLYIRVIWSMITVRRLLLGFEATNMKST